MINDFYKNFSRNFSHFCGLEMINDFCVEMINDFCDLEMINHFCKNDF